MEEDICKTFQEKIKSNPNYNRFWMDYHIYCKNFKIDDIELFVESLPILYDKIKNDGASYQIYEALRKFTIQESNKGIELLKLIQNAGDLRVLSFVPSILGGLSQSEKNYPFKEDILSLIKSDNDNEICAGVNSAYQVVIKDSEERINFLKDVNKALTPILNKKSSQCFGIITRFYNKNIRDVEEFREKVVRLLKRKEFVIQNEVARSLTEEIKREDNPEYFQRCLNLMVFTDVKHDWIYRTLYYRLKKEIVNNPKSIIEFINEWVKNNQGKQKGIKVLKDMIYDLYAEHPKVIRKLFLSWLNSDMRSYKIALHFLINELNDDIDVISLPKKDLKELSERDSLYIVFMIVGYIPDYKYTSEMLYNVLEANYENERIRNHIATLFAKHLIINHYSVTNILKAKRKKSNKIIKSIIDQVVSDSNNYYKQLSDLEFLNEFEPSETRMDYYYKQQNKLIQKLMNNEESRNESFLSMMTNISIRTGKSFFLKYDGKYTEESEMQNFKSSIEISRSRNIDEIGEEKLKLMWQNIKRDELPN